MRRGRLRFSGKERRAQLADSPPTETPAEETAPELVAEATDLAPELIGVEQEAPSAEVSTEETAVVESSDVPDLIAEAIELAPELVDMAQTPAEESEAAEAATPKKRATRRGGRGKGKKASAEAPTETESVTETLAPAEVKGEANAGDEVSTPEVALESAAVPDESADEKPKPKRRTVRRRPVAKKNAE